MRVALATLIAALIAVQVVRNAAVNAFADNQPAVAARVWSDHPRSEISLAMTEIAFASRNRRPLPPGAFSMIADAARKAPLSPEPFLVHGVQAQQAGDNATAERAFQAAQWRNPRSLPAAYFLADHYFRAGELERGLPQVAALARLSPVGGIAAVPYFVEYATDRRAWPVLRSLFRSNPQLARPVLVALASKSDTVPAVLALADPNDFGNPQWLVPLIDTLIKSGDYQRARQIWARTARPRSVNGDLLHDPNFSDKSSPPPFNWNLNSSTLGLAERRGGLHVVFYGDEDGTLASQLLVLRPGRYRMTMRLSRDSVRSPALTWSLWCDKAAEPIASITLDTAAARGWQFEVPSACRAQWLKLSGTSGDTPQQSDVTVMDLKLMKVSSDA